MDHGEGDGRRTAILVDNQNDHNSDYYYSMRAFVR